MAGNSLNKDRLEKEGQFVSYYENGKKESIKNYSRGKQMGKQYNWYPSGLIKSETDFLDGDIYHNASFKIIQFWDINANHKVIDGNGIYETKNEDFFETGQILNGLKNGQWKGAENNYTFIENYLDGNFIDGTSTDSNNIDRKYSSINTMGGFKKGSKHFYNFFPIHFIKPSEAKLNNIAGKTFVTFIIGENGKLGDLNLINKIGFGIDEEVVRVLKKYKDLTPYTKRGIPENILHSIGVIVE
jgi:antitoxin component YwqK of YwqJK toxin-antitoxin module